MTGDRDAALRARFRALAAEDAEAARTFAPPAAFRRVPLSARLVAVAAAAALAAGGYAWWALRAPVAPYPVDPAAVTWTGPTDFLLQTPGAALLRELPTIDTRFGVADADGSLDDTLRRNRI